MWSEINYNARNNMYVRDAIIWIYNNYSSQEVVGLKMQTSNINV